MWPKVNKLKKPKNDDTFTLNCDVCGELDCDIDHDEDEYFDDGSWLFDGSGMVGDV